MFQKVNIKIEMLDPRVSSDICDNPNQSPWVLNSSKTFCEVKGSQRRIH